MECVGPGLRLVRGRSRHRANGYRLVPPSLRWNGWVQGRRGPLRGGGGQRKVTGGSAGGWGYGQDQSTSAEWALAPSCDLWPASAPKAQILLTIASCSTWITLVFKHQQALRQTTGDVADTRETGDGRLERGTRGASASERSEYRKWG